MWTNCQMMRGFTQLTIVIFGWRATHIPPGHSLWGAGSLAECDGEWDGSAYTNDTYELTCLPQGREAVGGRWVYAAKLGHNNEEKFKARYVAKGYSQLPGIDYQEIFSPTARITSIRVLAQLAVQHILTIHQMDVKSAYLNAPIDCEIYVQQPEGFVVRGDDGEKLVRKLKKSLYGLKQSGRNWNNLLHGNLMDQGFSQSLADPCLYTRHGVDEMTVVVVWVDDIIIASSDATTLRDVKQSLSQQFDMHDLGELSWFLGIQFTCGDDFIKIDQTKYVEKILSKFGMSDCKPRQTPCEMKIVDDHSEKGWWWIVPEDCGFIDLCYDSNQTWSVFCSYQAVTTYVRPECCPFHYGQTRTSVPKRDCRSVTGIQRVKQSFGFGWSLQCRLGQLSR